VPQTIYALFAVKLMFKGVFALQPCNKSFAELFQKRPPALASASALFFL
jgi:hypothetical protein